MKPIYITILVFCFTGVLNSQDISFETNVNYAARVLKQNLNTSKDSLILESTEIIRDVEIFNDEYEEQIRVGDNETKIDLKNLPAGKYIVKASLGRKHIIMALEKSRSDAIVAYDSNTKTTHVDRFPNEAITNPNQDMVEEYKKPVQYYWVVSEVNSNSGSSRTMRLETKDEVDRLIRKNKLEQKSSAGKHNELYVYEIYDISEFMDKQSRNPEFYKTVRNSELFNAIPLYDTYSSEDLVKVAMP